ncbi:hypothetical protein [Kitasatospora sp. NPDC059827]|uniref:hypothetical protein n=1 Tax=Kitasatospora sp. NPDC059827 TaxID=3346964 RepID=UPI00366080C6
MHSTTTPAGPASTRRIRLAALLAAGACALLPLAGPVHAAPAKDPLPADIPDYTAALELVKSADVRDAVCRFLSAPLPRKDAPPAAQTIPDQAEPCAGLPAFTVNDPLALNELTPGFVAGTALPLASQAIRLSYLVSALNTTVNGRNATVLLAPTEGGGWHLAGVRDGNSDATYAGRATPGTLVFSEPQIRGWYQLRLTTVEPLNDQARLGLDGRPSASLSEYQKLVKARYADKLPGSEYAAAGMSSGYGTAARTAAAPSSTPVVIGGAAAALALAGGVLAFRRRRSSTR